MLLLGKRREKKKVEKIEIADEKESESKKRKERKTISRQVRCLQLPWGVVLE